MRAQVLRPRRTRTRSRIASGRGIALGLCGGPRRPGRRPFGAQWPGPHVPLSMLRRRPHGRRRMTRGRCDWLGLHRKELSSSTPHRLWPAHPHLSHLNPYSRKVSSGPSGICKSVIARKTCDNHPRAACPCRPRCPPGSPDPVRCPHVPECPVLSRNFKYFIIVLRETSPLPPRPPLLTPRFHRRSLKKSYPRATF